MDIAPILVYHDFCSQTDKTKNNFAVCWEDFKRQMDFLHQNGFAVVSLAQFLSSSNDTRKKILLTFDDGDISAYHFAFPILREKGFGATFFVTINEIGKKDRMDWTMIDDLSRNNMDIGSHSLTHSFLTSHNNYTLLNELLSSKQILEKYIRKRVDFLSIPHGFYNKNITAIAKDIGYRSVCTSDAGYNNFTDDDSFVLKRFTMRRHYNLDAFKSIVNGAPAMGVVALEQTRTFLRKILGYQVYDRLRSLRYGVTKKHTDHE